LIHELAHEMKNPMVTIKTFAQLLDDRYEDEDFRARFRDVVSCDIERMDDLLEMMIEFADFSQPRVDRASLDERLRWAVDEVGEECGKRQAAIRLQSSRIATAILADENQLDYILKNVLSAVVSQAKLGSEIGVEIQQAGTVVISYFREGPRMASITQYLGSLSEAAGESILPLRILLAKQLVERNGGEMAVDSTDAEKEIVTMEFPIA
jgi:signal transduction histidine kinase